MIIQVERWHPHAFVDVITFRNGAVRIVITAVPKSFREACGSISYVHE